MRTVFPDELHEDAPVTFAALRELRTATRSFPDAPVAVLSAARGSPPVPRELDTPAGRARRSSPAGTPCVVDRTGHNIPRNQPGVVARTILEVVAAAQVGSA